MKVFRCRNVKLIDATKIKQAGKGKRGGKELRVHMCYSLTAGCMYEVLVTDNHTSEKTAHFTIEEYDLFIADRAYGLCSNIKLFISGKADYLFRITPSHAALFEDAKGKKRIDAAKMICEAKKDNKDKIDIPCYIRDGKEYILTRLVMGILPEDKREKAVGRAIRNAKKKKVKEMKPETLDYAEWVILLTSLSKEEYSAEAILKLYKCRWQVELLFKNIKQSLHIVKLPAASLAHSETLVLLWILLWSIAEQEAFKTEIYAIENGEDMSTYPMFPLQREQLRQVKINIGYYSSEENTPESSASDIRHLRSHKAERSNQCAEHRFGKVS
jgi:hypothetical protein